MSKDILIVDDNPANLKLLHQFLTEQGYRVRPATSGSQALAATEASKPDLILLDINMPHMDGYEVCSRLKAEPETASIPVIFISALDKTEGKVKALSGGGVDYITKPFQVEEVYARVQTHLKIQELQHDLEERNRELAAFGRMVAHDLKTPLMTIIMASDIMNMDPGERTPENLSHIKAAAKKIDTIIESLFLLASVGRDKVQVEAIDMASVVAEAKLSIAQMASDSSAMIIQEPDSWPDALGYAPWVAQIWTNYLSNSIKYGGRPPQISLGADELPDGQIRFWVRDNGPGIGESDCKRLFREFTRLGQTEVAGHGLGLSIVARIATKLGGRVGVESQLEAGSLFYFTLPPVNQGQLIAPGAATPTEAAFGNSTSEFRTP